MKEYESIGDDIESITSNAISLLIVNIEQCLKSQKRTSNVSILDAFVAATNLRELSNRICLFDAVRNFAS